MTDWTAIVLTGGSSRRFGRDKITENLAGRRLIDRVLDGLPADVPIVVVGPDPSVGRPVVVAREDPPGGGPAAGIAAALAHVTTPLVAVIAGDMPFAVPALLRMPRPRTDAVVPRAGGHPQPLCAWYRSASLRAAQPTAGMSMRTLLSRLEVEWLDLPSSDFADIDTAADLQAAQRRIMGGMDIWVDAVKQELGIEADVDIAVILDVAKDAAHAVQRPAAPVTTYLLGLAVASGAEPAAAAAAIARLAQSWPGDA